MRSPAKIICPPAARTTPEIVFNVVLLPAPLAPTSVAISASRTANVTPHKT